MTPRTRVVVLVPSLAGGGAERATIAIANHLDTQRFEAVLVSASDSEAAYDVADHVQQLSLAGVSIWRSVWHLSRLLRRLKTDVIYTGLPHLNAVAVLAAALSGRRVSVVGVVHNNLIAEFPELPGGRVWRRLTPIVHRLMSRTVCVSQGVADQCVTVFGARRDRVVIIPNPVDLAKARELASSDLRWPFPDGARVVVGVGRLVPQKGFDRLVEAVAVAAQEYDLSSSLVLVGEGPEEASLRALAARLGVSDSVHFVGRSSNPFAYMARANRVVLTSRYEGFGMVLVEALAVGAPVVAVDCDFGPREVLRDGAFGVLVEPDDIGALARAITSDYTVTPSSDELGEHLRAFDPQRVADAVAEVLDAVQRKSR